MGLGDDPPNYPPSPRRGNEGGLKKKLEKRFGGKEKSCTFAATKQGQHLYKVAKFYYKPISVEVSYSRNAIHQCA